MGQGKTLVALADFWRWYEEGEGTRMFVCCPNSFKSGWRAEVIKHGFDLDVHLYQSGSKASKAWLTKKYTKPPILVINYEALRSDKSFKDFVAWCEAKPTFGVWDEAIRLKNNKGVTSKRAVQLAKYFGAARCLSGKYTTQGPHDLWAQFRALRLLYGINFYAFRTMYAKMGGWQGRQVIGVQNEKQLARLLDPYVFQTAPTPKAPGQEPRFVVRTYELTPEMQAQYDAMHQEFVLWLNQNEAVTVELAITRYIKLAQIQAGFVLKDDGKIVDLVAPKDNPRLEVLKEILAEEIDGKCCVTYKHRYANTLLMAALETYQPAWIKGGMRPEEVQAQLDRFELDPNCRVMLLQTQAGKYGFNCLGNQAKAEDACHSMIFWENSYSLDDRAQIEARIDRRGQNYRCLYIDLIGTALDQACIDALVRKENMFQTVFRAIRTTIPEMRHAS